MNFGPETSEDDSHAIMDRALELGINFFDTANRYGGSKGAGNDRRDHSGGGSRWAAAAARRSCWRRSAMDRCRTGRTTVGCRRATSAPRATTACAACRPTTSTSIRCTTSTGMRPWDEIWQAMDTLGAAGQDHLRRQQQLRRLAHHQGQRAGRGARLVRARQRAEPLQPARSHDRARGAAGVSRLWRRRDPVEPAGGRRAGRGPQQRIDVAAQERHRR